MTDEIDESVVTKRKYNRGRVAENNQVWLIGGICRETREFFLELVQKRDAVTLHEIIMRRVAPGSTILTDGWRAYNGLGNSGYSHATVNHSENFADPNDPLVHTQSIENLWRWIKPFSDRTANVDFF
uniref:DDE_Tnp_IS1595 domain-containing protein n=1 Tax=Anopheles minimus TaxID=112268 RepID=A0A182W7W5_9DIPT